MKPPISAEVAIAKAQQAKERCTEIALKQLMTSDMDEYWALSEEFDLRKADQAFYENIAFAPVAGVYDDEKKAVLN